MRSRYRQPSMLAVLVSLVMVVTAASQSPKFPGGVFKGTTPDAATIALDFDSTGVLTAYVNDQAFSNAKYETRADTMTVGLVNGPEGYTCAGSGKYLWAIAESRLTFTLVADDCQIRRDTFTMVTWTRGP